MESWPWTISICGVATRFQGSSSAPLVSRCVVMTVILSSATMSLSPQGPASHLCKETAPTGKETIHSFLFLGALLFSAAIAACWCQSMTCQCLGYHAQLLQMWMCFHQEVLHFIGSFFLEPKQALYDIDEWCRIVACTEHAKVLVVASAAI